MLGGLKWQLEILSSQDSHDDINSAAPWSPPSFLSLSSLSSLSGSAQKGPYEAAPLHLPLSSSLFSSLLFFPSSLHPPLPPSFFPSYLPTLSNPEPALPLVQKDLSPTILGTHAIVPVAPSKQIHQPWMLKGGSEDCTGTSFQPRVKAPLSPPLPPGTATEMCWFSHLKCAVSGNILFLPILKSRVTSSTLSLLLCKFGPLHSPHPLFTEDTSLLGDPGLSLFSGHFSLNLLPPLRRQVSVIYTSSHLLLRDAMAFKQKQ